MLFDVSNSSNSLPEKSPYREPADKSILSVSVPDFAGHIADIAFNKIICAKSGCQSAEGSCQNFLQSFYEAYSSSVVLSRFFVAQPFKLLPSKLKSKAMDAGAERNQLGLLPESTIMCLAGTYGQEDNWRDIRDSKKHRFIPLSSTEATKKIPMMASMLRQVVGRLDWLNRDMVRTQQLLSHRTLTSFYIKDAKTTVNEYGALIIPGQDFVEAYGIKTVIGRGVTFVNGTLMFMIVFSRDSLTRAHADALAPALSVLKAHIGPCVERNNLFRDDL